MEKKLLKSQDLMSMFGVTRNTLRFYEKRGLLKPSIVDSATGYRYYGFAEIDKLHLILLYKESGMKLAEIEDYIGGRITADDLEKELNRRLEAIRTGLDILHSNNVKDNKYAVERIVLPETVCVVEPVLSTGAESVAAIFFGFGDQTKNKGFKMRHKFPDFIEWLDDDLIENGFFSDKMPVNLCMEADSDDPTEHTVAYPSSEAIATCHVGGYQNIADAYNALLNYMRKNNLVQNGHAREVYLLGPFAVNIERFVTRVIIPVRKA